MKNFINSIREELSSIWTLLNDTTIFLTKIKKFSEYESEIKRWRAKLNKYSGNPDVRKEIRQNIIALRNFLRKDGYNLKLGSKDLIVSGFRSDDAPLEGLKRIVIVIINDDIYYKTGSENHLELLRFLALSLGYQDTGSLSNAHNLWYKWRNNILYLHGADSESQEDFTRFKSYVSKNKNFLLKKLRNLY